LGELREVVRGWEEGVRGINEMVVR
jgi:hypothetical protein